MYTRHRSVTVGSVFTDPVVSITDLLDLSAMSLNLCTVVIVDSCCIGTCDGIIGLKMSFYQIAVCFLNGFLCCCNCICICRILIDEFLCISDCLIKCCFCCSGIIFTRYFFKIFLNGYFQNCQCICLAARNRFYNDVVYDRIVTGFGTTGCLNKYIQFTVCYGYFISTFKIFGCQSGFYFFTFQKDVFCLGSPLMPWIVDTYGYFIIAFRQLETIINTGFSCFVSDFI